MSHLTFMLAKRAKEAKFWLEPVKMARPGRFKPVELREIERIVKDNRDFLSRAWKKEQGKRANG